jgi:hypothetical protein
MSNQSQIGTQLILLAAGAVLLYYAVIRPARKGTKGDLPRRAKASAKQKTGVHDSTLAEERPVEKKKVHPASPEGMNIRFQHYLEEHAPRQRGVELRRWPVDPNGYYPDLELVIKEAGVEQRFAIECKFRSKVEDGFVEFAYDEQLKRYKAFEEQTKEPVVVMLGIGGEPESPAQVYAVPLVAIYQPYLSEQQLKGFEVEDKDDLFYFFQELKK